MRDRRRRAGVGTPLKTSAGRHGPVFDRVDRTVTDIVAATRYAPAWVAIAFVAGFVLLVAMTAATALKRR